MVPRPRFESATSRIQVRRISTSADLLVYLLIAYVGLITYVSCFNTLSVRTALGRQLLHEENYLTFSNINQYTGDTTEVL
jgi:hypothetical protein